MNSGDRMVSKVVGKLPAGWMGSGERVLASWHWTGLAMGSRPLRIKQYGHMGRERGEASHRL